VTHATFRIKRFHDDVIQARKYTTNFCSPWSQPNGQNEGTIYGPTRKKSHQHWANGFAYNLVNKKGI
jgi:hypothetical protein